MIVGGLIGGLEEVCGSSWLFWALAPVRSLVRQVVAFLNQEGSTL